MITFVEIRNVSALRRNTCKEENIFLEKLLRHLKKIDYYPRHFDAEKYQNYYLYRTGGWIQALSSHLKKYETNVLWYTGEENIEQALENTRIALISISETISYPLVKKFIKKVRRLYSNIKIIVGGLHASITINETFRDLRPDILFVGEADAKIEEIINLKNKEPLILSDENGAVSEEIIVDDWDLFFRYSDHLVKRIPYILTSRDCPYSCNFCSIIKRGSMREVKIKNIEKSLKVLKNGNEDDIRIYIESPLPFYNKKRTEELILTLKEMDLKWCCDFRIIKPTKETDNLFRDLYSSGCRHIYFGTETFNQKVSDLANKKINVKNIIPLAKQVTNNGIKVHTGWLVGLPGQTEEIIKKDLETVLENIENGNFAVAEYKFLTLYPNTKFYKNATDFGIKVENYNYKDIENYPMHSTLHLKRHRIFELYLEGLCRIGEVLFKDD